ncbi:acetylcholinesterase-like [Dermacentor andersoni]|uniref:acetylcholinesterase-like n=1 Tax=Dermacentor andersoni TaxID=34620 RepID=UPI0024167473|nr:acetylcholinesterase-like [Dermacentor andersoni]
MVSARSYVSKYVVLVWTAWFVDAAIRESPVIRTDSGLVSGVREVIDGREVDMYLGIPYAEPPRDLLRFSKPIPIKPWNGTLKATTRPKPCPQNIHYLTDEVSFYYTKNSEDCLYLNIRKPASDCKQEVCSSKLPVVVFMHGGCFQWSDSGLFMHDGGNFAALTDTIMVSFNYRLNVFGFLSAGNEEVAGNWGLWDQNLVLRWIQRNINSFGGDPSEVTIMGHSAGGISAGFHAVSPQSVGLFKRMILQSGSPMNAIASLSARTVGSVMELGADLACEGVRERKLGVVMDCLRGRDKNLLLGQLSGIDLRKSLYGPIYGDEYVPDDPLLISSWKKKIKSKEIMIGTTSNEGSMFLYGAMKIVPQLKSLLAAEYRSTITIAISTTLGISIKGSREITNAYFADWKGEHTEDEVLQVLGNILGDGLFVCPATIFADIASEQKIPVFRYTFDYRPSFSFWPDWFQVAHGDDLPFTLGSLLFYGDESRFEPGIRKEDYDFFKQLKYSSAEKDFMKAVVESMSEFVKTGKPTIPETKDVWPRYSSANPQYINIRPGNTTKRRGPNIDICKVWRRVLMKEEPDTGTREAQEKRTPSKTSRKTTLVAHKKAQEPSAKHVSGAAESSYLGHYLSVASAAFVLSVHIAAGRVRA